MSLNLYWEPADREANDLPDELKYVMRKRFDGAVDTVFDEGDAHYIQGLRDAGVKGAQELLDAIAKHGSVRVFERG